MRETIWFLIVGGMFVGMGVASSLFKRLPLTGAMLYLAAGFALGPKGGGLLALDITKDAALVRLLTEVALLASLFAIGLRLRAPIFASLWTLPVRLGLLAMLVTVPLLACFGAWGLGLAWGPAWVLAAMLAPTDPVLAHDVQVRDANDLDIVRFALSGEGGLNDGIALPFALIALACCTAGPGSAHAVPVLRTLAEKQAQLQRQETQRRGGVHRGQRVPGVWFESGRNIQRQDVAPRGIHGLDRRDPLWSEGWAHANAQQRIDDEIV